MTKIEVILNINGNSVHSEKRKKNQRKLLSHSYLCDPIYIYIASSVLTSIVFTKMSSSFHTGVTPGNSVVGSGEDSHAIQVCFQVVVLSRLQSYIR